MFCCYPKHFVHPLAPYWHILVAIGTFALHMYELSQGMFTSESLIAVWAAHSILLLGALIEVLCVKRWRWRQGAAWWFAMMFSIMVCFDVNLPSLLIHASEN